MRINACEKRSAPIEWTLTSHLGTNQLACRHAKRCATLNRHHKKVRSAASRQRLQEVQLSARLYTWREWTRQAREGNQSERTCHAAALCWYSGATGEALPHQARVAHPLWVQVPGRQVPQVPGHDFPYGYQRITHSCATRDRQLPHIC